MTNSTSHLNAFTRLSLTITFLLTLALTAIGQTISADADPLTRLMKGNARFVAGITETHDYRAERSTLTQGQKPYAIVLSCADSRVPPELVFDESLGRLFVVRTAGHVVDPVALGSIEYAVEHLGVKHLFVLGHESCGAVKATIGGGAVPPNIKALLNRIQPAVDKTRAASVSEPLLLKRAIQENVRYQMQEALFESDVLSEFVHENKLRVSGGVYNLASGAVEYLNVDLAVYRTGKDGHHDSHQADAAAPHGPAQAAPAMHAAPAQHATDAEHAPGTHTEPAKNTQANHAAPGYNAKKAIHKPVLHAVKAPAHAAPARAQAAPAAKAPKAHGAEPTHSAPAHSAKAVESKPAAKKPAHDTHSSLAPSQRPRTVNLEQDLQLAFAAKKDIVVTKPTLMRDSQDRCATQDCRRIEAGEKIKLESPTIVKVMGRPQIKVRYKGKPYFILADTETLAVSMH